VPLTLVGFSVLALAGMISEWPEEDETQRAVFHVINECEAAYGADQCQLVVDCPDGSPDPCALGPELPVEPEGAPGGGSGGGATHLAVHMTHSFGETTSASPRTVAFVRTSQRGGFGGSASSHHSSGG
jgi:uncharacterized protein YgiB involved in biofilm formation